jgi:hypothetical protein
VIEGQQSIVYFRSKALVIAGGAQQGLDKRLTGDWFPNLAPEKLIPSDSFLKKNIYLSTLERLRNLPNGRKPKVVIIGGSHSGFSCAWLLLNGPAMFQKCFKVLQQTTPQDENQLAAKIPHAYRKQVKNCIPCCTCGNALEIATRKLAAQKNGGHTQN